MSFTLHFSITKIQSYFMRQSEECQFDGVATPCDIRNAQAKRPCIYFNNIDYRQPRYQGLDPP